MALDFSISDKTQETDGSKEWSDLYQLYQLELWGVQVIVEGDRDLIA